MRAKDLWGNWSKESKKYKGESEINAKWKSFSSNSGSKLLIGTLNRHAYAGGYTDDVTDMLKSMHNDEVKNRFSLIHAADFKNFNNIDWLIKGVIPKKGLMMIYGASGSGKTFFALDVFMSILHKNKWNNRQIKSVQKIVYIAAEGKSGIPNRLEAYAKANEISLNDIELYFIREALNLNDDDDKVLINFIKDFGGADVIIIDTLAQVTSGADENSGEAMSKFISRCNNIVDGLNCLVVVVHHSGKQQSKGPRGWSGMYAALDTAIEVLNSDGISKVIVKKQKDGESDSCFYFTLSNINLGYNDEGEEITSCTIRYANEEFKVTSKPKLGKNQKIIVKAIEEVMRETVEDKIKIDDVINSANKLFVSDGNESPRNDSLHRAIESLVKKNLIEIDGCVITDINL